MNDFVLWFEEYEPAHLPIVGGKNRSLGEMTRAGLPVPPGFALTTLAYEAMRDQDELARREVRELLSQVDLTDASGLQELAAKVRRRIEAIPMPAEVERALRDAYAALCERCGVDDVPVAVRSSATAEDLVDASFAGLQDTFLWVRGIDDVLAHVQRCWSSCFTDRAIAYRHEMGHDHDRLLMSVAIQKMVRPKAAGVAFTLNPSDGDRSQVAIDSAWGFGEAVVSGEVTPDNFLVDKVIYEIVSRTISPKVVEYRLDEATNRVVKAEVPDDRVNAPSLTDDEAKAVAAMARRAERHFGGPQDVEWAIDADLPDGENVILLQSRPETVWSQKPRTPVARATSDPIEGIVATLLNPVHTRGRGSTVGE